MHQKLLKKGVVVVALSYEKEALVTKHLKNNETPYIVGAATKCRKAWGVPGYPTFFVVDPKGVIRYKGHLVQAAEKSIRKLMKETPPRPGAAFGDPNADAEEAFQAAEKDLKKKRYAKAFKRLESIVKDFSDTAAGVRAKERLAELRKDKKLMARYRSADAKKKCRAWLDMARSLAKAGKPEVARKYYQRVLDKFGDTKYAETARSEMARL